MIGHVNETFRKTAPVVNRSSFEKVELGQAAVTGSDTGNVDMSSVSFWLRPNCCPMFLKFAKKTRN